jgi:hypothetical protein
MSRKWLLWFIPIFFVLTGCEERYRYPCQDPDNWNQKICQKPFCSANGTCPEDLTHYEKKGAVTPTSTVAPQLTNKGVCK